MKNFLADYGLYWVGGNKVTSENNRPTSDQLQKQGFACDFDLFVKNINELNSLVENNNEKKIVQFKNNSVKFETSESVKLTLYSNGIVLYEGPFRPFTDSLTSKFCIDIMDGYFPSELESKYPDGVRLELIDKRDILFKQKEINSVFRSKGYRLGSGNDIEQNHPHITFKENSSELLSQFESSKNIETQLTGYFIIFISQPLQEIFGLFEEFFELVYYSYDHLLQCFVFHYNKNSDTVMILYYLFFNCNYL